MITRKFVLLLKAQKTDELSDKYEIILGDNGYQVKQVKTLEFTYKNLATLKSCLDKPELFSGIIFSSPRCVYSTKLALNNTELHNEWAHKDNFVVGETTCEEALKELGLRCLGKETGNADNLSEVILESAGNYSRPFLFPHGNLNIDILKDKFNGSNLELAEVLVYETVASPNIETEFYEVTNGFESLPEYVVLFSPSGVKAVFCLLNKLPVNIDLIKLIAIGPTTEKAMGEHGLNIYGVAERPTPQDLLKILK